MAKTVKKQETREIKQGIWKHFKGKEYAVLHTAEHTETGEIMVVYKAMYGEGKIYVRPLDMFMSEVDKEKYPEVQRKYRFEFVADFF